MGTDDRSPKFTGSYDSSIVAMWGISNIYELLFFVLAADVVTDSSGSW